MESLTAFMSNLGNTYTAALIAAITGFVIGQSIFSGRTRIVVGLIVAVIFTVLSLLITSFIDRVYPDNFTLSVNVKFFYTIVLLIILIYFLAYGASLRQLLAQTQDFIETRSPTEA
jgi:hypothetical protein